MTHRGELEVLMALLETSPAAGCAENLFYVGQLDRFAAGLPGGLPSEPLAGDVAPVRRLRDRLVPAVLEQDRAQARAGPGALAREHVLTPAFDDVGQLGYVPGREGFASELAARLVPVVMELHATGRIGRVRSCAAPGCPVPFLDATKRRQRLHCSGACSARMRMRRRRRPPS